MNKIYGSADLIAEGKNISYVLSAGIDIDTGKLYMPSLEFIKDKGFTDTEKIIDFWDNDEFIMKLHQKILIPYVNSVSGIKGKKYKKALFDIKGVVVDDLPLLHDLIEKGIQMKFFNSYLEQK